MRAAIILITTFLYVSARSQIQVKADSIIEIRGTWAKLRGKELRTDTAVYFVYHWRGNGKIILAGQWFTIYWPDPKRQRGRLIFVQKNQ